MKKQVIAVDLDDVLAAGAQGFIDFTNKRWGTNLTVNDFSERWGDIWGVELEEEIERAEVVYEARVIREFNALYKAKPVLTRLAGEYKLVIMTSRVQRMQQDTFDWLDKHYEGIFEEIHFSGFYDKITKHSHNYTKAELCREIGADYLIDDQLKHCFGAAEAGIKTLLFGDYKWNQAAKLPAGVVRVKDWTEVEEYFNAK